MPTSEASAVVVDIQEARNDLPSYATSMRPDSQTDRIHAVVFDAENNDSLHKMFLSDLRMNTPG